MKKKSAPEAQPEKVNEFMQKLDHPFKAEVQALRKIIKKVDKHIAEEVKWNAPSYNYKGEYLVTFNLRAKQHIHLVFHNPMISRVKSKLLEGGLRRPAHGLFFGYEGYQGKKACLGKSIEGFDQVTEKR